MTIHNDGTFRFNAPHGGPLRFASKQISLRHNAASRSVEAYDRKFMKGQVGREITVKFWNKGASLHGPQKAAVVLYALTEGPKNDQERGGD